MADPDIYKFPQGFMIGSASSAYQIEGAWNEDGKGENIWDRHVHTHPDYVCDGSSGDVACDSYHKYKEDVKALKHMGMYFISFACVLLIAFFIAVTSGKRRYNKENASAICGLLNPCPIGNVCILGSCLQWVFP